MLRSQTTATKYQRRWSSGERERQVRRSPSPAPHSRARRPSASIRKAKPLPAPREKMPWALPVRRKGRPDPSPESALGQVRQTGHDDAGPGVHRLLPPRIAAVYRVRDSPLLQSRSSRGRVPMSHPHQLCLVTSHARAHVELQRLAGTHAEAVAVSGQAHGRLNFAGRVTSTLISSRPRGERTHCSDIAQASISISMSSRPSAWRGTPVDTGPGIEKQPLRMARLVCRRAGSAPATSL